MKLLIQKGRLVDPVGGIGGVMDILIEDGKLAVIGSDLREPEAQVLDARGLTVCAGLVDMHVHLREPGFEYKEDISHRHGGGGPGGLHLGGLHAQHQAGAGRPGAGRLCPPPCLGVLRGAGVAHRGGVQGGEGGGAHRRRGPQGRRSGGPLRRRGARPERRPHAGRPHPVPGGRGSPSSPTARTPTWCATTPSTRAGSPGPWASPAAPPSPRS